MYYLRERTGKSARIAEKIKKKIGIDVTSKTEEVKKTTEEKKVETKEANQETILSKTIKENKEKK